MPDNRGPDINDAALDELLTPPLASAGIDDSRIAELLAAIEADDSLTSAVQGPLKPRRPGRRRAAVIGGGLALAIGIGIASPAAADFVQRFLAQTGDFGSSDPTDEGSSRFGELIEVTAPDFPEYALTIIPEWLPVPDGIDRNALMESTIDKFAHPDPSNLMLEPGEKAEDVDVVWHRVAIQHEFERVAFIAWLNEWVDAHEVGDNDRATHALQVLNEATTWPAIVATDGGGVVDGMRRLIAAAESGNADTVAQYAEMFNRARRGADDHLSHSVPPRRRRGNHSRAVQSTPVLLRQEGLHHRGRRGLPRRNAHRAVAEELGTGHPGRPASIRVRRRAERARGALPGRTAQTRPGGLAAERPPHPRPGAVGRRRQGDCRPRRLAHRGPRTGRADRVGRLRCRGGGRPARPHRRSVQGKVLALASRAAEVAGASVPRDE